MPEDLPQRIRERIEFDESLFDPAICVTNENTFYWSVEGASNDLINLHGCQGAIYWYERPLSRLSRVEWFQ